MFTKKTLYKNLHRGNILNQINFNIKIQTTQMTFNSGIDVFKQCQYIQIQKNAKAININK